MWSIRVDEYFVTGESGYFGSHAVLVLSQLARKAVLHDNLSNSSSIVYAHPQYLLTDGNQPIHKSTPMVKASYTLKKSLKALGALSIKPPHVWPVND